MTSMMTHGVVGSDPRLGPVPVLDLGPWLAGEDGAEKALANGLRSALEEIGFFFVVNHGIDWAMVDSVYECARRLHALPDPVKEAMPMSARQGGYLTLGGGTSYASAIAGEIRKPNLNAAFFMHRGGYRDANQWPPLDGFQTTVERYLDAMTAFARSLLPLYAASLSLAPDFFDAAFEQPSTTLRLSHYPLVDHEDSQWGLAPHTDSSFMTLLPANDVPGLWIRPEGHDWIEPPALPRSFLINSGDILRRWTNDRFLSTAHRVMNASGTDRYAMPFFYGARDDAMVEALPTCVSKDHPALHPPITYGEYQRWFLGRNYASYAEYQSGEQAP
ncbi:MAG: isopenicillin N synthase family dioxygenase [Acidimicrobiales bacterium]